MRRVSGVSLVLVGGAYCSDTCGMWGPGAGSSKLNGTRLVVGIVTAETKLRVAVDGVALTDADSHEVDLSAVLRAGRGISELDHHAPVSLRIDVDLVASVQRAAQRMGAAITVDKRLQLDQGKITHLGRQRPQVCEGVGMRGEPKPCSAHRDHLGPGRGSRRGGEGGNCEPRVGALGS